MNSTILKILILNLGIILSSSILAQRRPNECSRPNIVINKIRGPIEGQVVRHVFQLNGKNLEGNFEGRERLSTNLMQVWNVLFCQPTKYTYSFNDCRYIDPDIALGKGNDDFKFIFNNRLSLFKRAQRFTQVLTFATQRPVSQKERISLAILQFHDQTFENGEIVNISNWKDIEILLDSALQSGVIENDTFNDITNQFQAQNKRALGLVVMPDVEIKEGRGNNRFSRLFDLSISLLKRAEIVQAGFKGINNADTALKLAQHFIKEAATVGIPKTWKQLGFMFDKALELDIVTTLEFDLALSKFEQTNRTYFGFEITATKCVMKQVNDVYNKRVEKIQKEFIRTVSADVRLDVKRAPLTSNERINIEAIYDGVRPLRLSYNNSYIRFATPRIDDQGKIISIILNGIERTQVTPRNTLEAQIKSGSGKKIIFNINDLDHDPEYQGKTMVKVELIQKRLFNKKLAEKTFEMIDGKISASMVANIKKGKKVFIKYSIQRMGSPYFNANFSSDDKTDTVKVK